MTNLSFKDTFADINKLKEEVRSLDYKQIGSYRDQFYKKDYPEWILNLMWEYIWDDITYEQLYCIFKSKKMI